MLQKIRNSIGFIAAAVIAILSLLFLMEKDGKQEAQEKLVNKEADDKDKVLAQQEVVVQADVTKTEEQAKQEEAAPMSQDQTVDMLNKL